MREFRGMKRTVLLVHDHDHVKVVDAGHRLHVIQDVFHALVFDGPSPDLGPDLEL
jgi:hypothetical protein